MSLEELRGPLCYLATPYTKYPAGIEQAYHDAKAIAAGLLKLGVKAYSPIVYTHKMAIEHDIDPLDHSIWVPFDEAMMTASEALIVAHLESWETSFGVTYEIDHFERAGKPIFDLIPDTLMMKKRNGAHA